MSEASCCSFLPVPEMEMSSTKTEIVTGLGMATALKMGPKR